MDTKKIVGFIFFFFVFGSVFAVFAESDPRDSQNPFGVLDFLAWDHSWNGYHYGADEVERAATLMEEAGVGFVRVDFPWSDIEPEKGRFDFEKSDRIVSILSKHGIRILAMLHYNAAWAGEWNEAPSESDFLIYAEAVVDRYKDRIRYWEIWNEPDSDIYWKPQDEMKSYVSLLKAVYPVIKKVDPTSKVVLGGLSQNIPISARRVYKNGGKDFFDVMNIHPFIDPLLPNPLELLRSEYRGVRRIMNLNGDGEKPVWFTEIGCPGTGDTTRKNWWKGRNPTEAEQAWWVEALYRESLTWEGVERVFWAFFRDTPDHFKNGIDQFGLVRLDFSKKPAYEAYQRVALHRSKDS